MLRTTLLLGLAVHLAPLTAAEVEKPVDIADKSTHQQVAVIKMSGEEQPLKINAFCLDRKDRIVAVCGNGPGEVRVVDDTGKILKSWAVSVKPEAVNVAEDGSVFVGGDGKLFHFSAEGKELQQAESPHAHKLRTNTEALRKEAIARLTRTSNSLQSRIQLYEQVISQLEEKGKKTELNDQEMKLLETLPKTLAQFRKQAEEQPAEKKNEPSEERIQQYVESLVRSKMRISSISSDRDSVFVATRAQTGYGFEVWKMTKEFSEGKVIITGLSGCCGQMDVQCCSNGLFVAENSRHRVVRYDTSGKEMTKWGQRDRKGVDGFSSCCNPMNVCFNGAGDVFTAESGTGRIKKFSADGSFVSYVGDVDLVPGCKNVSIAVVPDASKIYMLDLTRNHIVRMETKPEPTPSADASAAEEGE